MSDHSMLSQFQLPKSNNPMLWQKRDGRWVMPEKQSKFLDWLLTPLSEREQKTIKAWAEANGVNPGTPGDWKKDRRFKREWEDRANSKNIGVERMQSVLDTLYEAAVNGDVAAAKLYIQETEKLRPTRVVEVDRDVEQLSDEELNAEIRSLLGDEAQPNRELIDGEAVQAWSDAPADEGLGQAEG